MLLQPNTCFVLNFEAKANKIKSEVPRSSLRPGERVGHSSSQQSWGVFWNILINRLRLRKRIRRRLRLRNPFG
jgi:hypothetical protein